MVEEEQHPPSKLFADDEANASMVGIDVNYVKDNEHILEPRDDDKQRQNSQSLCHHWSSKKKVLILTAVVVTCTIIATVFAVKEGSVEACDTLHSFLGPNVCRDDGVISRRRLENLETDSTDSGTSESGVDDIESSTSESTGNGNDLGAFSGAAEGVDPNGSETTIPIPQFPSNDAIKECVVSQIACDTLRETFKSNLAQLNAACIAADTVRGKGAYLAELVRYSSNEWVFHDQHLRDNPDFDVYSICGSFLNNDVTKILFLGDGMQLISGDNLILELDEPLRVHAVLESQGTRVGSEDMRFELNKDTGCCAGFVSGYNANSKRWDIDLEGKAIGSQNFMWLNAVVWVKAEPSEQVDFVSTLNFEVCCNKEDCCDKGGECCDGKCCRSRQKCCGDEGQKKCCSDEGDDSGNELQPCPEETHKLCGDGRCLEVGDFSDCCSEDLCVNGECPKNYCGCGSWQICNDASCNDLNNEWTCCKEDRCSNGWCPGICGCEKLRCNPGREPPHCCDLGRYCCNPLASCTADFKECYCEQVGWHPLLCNYRRR